MLPSSSPRVVLAHDWLTGMRGGEKVLEELCRIFPTAPVLTLIHVPGSVSPLLESRRVSASALQRLPGIGRWYRQALPLMPWAVAGLRVPPCDLLLSSSHCAIKALRPPRGARHLCYIHTPMRYVWDQAESYFGPGRVSAPTRLLAKAFLPALRRWDFATTGRVDRFLANSHNVAERVWRIYRRQSGVLHPFIDLDRFALRASPPEAGVERPYLMVTAFAPYKRIEVAIEAFRRLQRPLAVVGSGQLFERLKPLFGGAIRALGALSDGETTELYQRCRAFVMPGEEDFGLAPLEAQASGRPVVALGKGGALETVVPLGKENPTGVLYEPRSDRSDAVGDLVEAVRRFEANEALFRPEACRKQAERFSRERFRQGVLDEVGTLLGERVGVDESATAG